MRTCVWLFRSLLMVASSCAVVSGCALLVGGAAVGTAAGTVYVGTDRRSVSTQYDDTKIAHQINSTFKEHFANQSVRIDVTAYDHKVLLAGQVPSEKDRTDAEGIAAGTQGVRQVVNELTIGSLTSMPTGTQDSALAGEVRGALLNASGLPPGVVLVSCTGGTIYLFGRVGSKEAEVAEHAASRVGGVKRVVALFDLLSDAELAQILREEQPGPPPSTFPGTGARP